MLSADRLKGIEAFVATADAGSFAAAASRLNLTASAVGKTVARLEQRLGVRLFERTTRAMALTDAGAAFQSRCTQVLASLDEAEAVLATPHGEPSGRLRIDAGAAFGRIKVLPLLLQFTLAHPGLRPHLSFTDRIVDLVDEGIDVAVRIGGSDVWPTALGHRYLATERLVFCAAPACLARDGVPADRDELAARAAVVYGRADGSVAPWWLAQADAPAERLVPNSRVIVGNGEAQVSAVVAGCGVAQLATWLIEDELHRGALVEILPALATDGLPLHLVWQRNRQLLPKVAALLELLGHGLRID